MTAKRVSRSKPGKKSGRDVKSGKFSASLVESLGSQKSERPKLKPKIKLDAAWIKDKAERAVTVAAWVFLLADIFLIPSIFTNWTGALGRAAREQLLGGYGVGVLIILFFISYLCLSWIMRKPVPQPLRQACGTVLLYLCLSLFLGLFDMVFKGEAASLLSPGSVGRGLAGWSFENLGPLGTILLGLSIIFLTLHCFGYTAPFEALKALFARLSAKERGRPFKHVQAEEYDEADESEDGADEEDDEEIYGDETEEYDQSEYDGSDSEYADGGQSADAPVIDELAAASYEAHAPAGRFPPPPEIFGKEGDDEDLISEETARPWGDRIIDSLAEFGIEAELAEILLGPTVIQFRIQPSPGVKVSRITGLSNDLAMALAVSSLRVEAPIPGKPYVGIEIPNPVRRGITLRSIIEEEAYQKTTKSLPLPMGVTINGDALIVGLEDLPHLLVAGTTGSGKSVFVNGCIIGLCSMRRPDELKMVLVDPKRVEMAAYEKLPHILTPPVTDPKKAVHVLGWAIREMERRYSCFAEARVRNLASYNELVLPKDRLPHIVIVVDELADLMMTAAKEVEEYICRLAQMARATGIHLMLATQRPSVNVITGLIKANVPARVAFTLPSMMDSRTIIDGGGAEKLLGRGDMLFLSTQNPKPLRVQSPWIDERSVNRWINYLVNMFGEPEYVDIYDQGSAPEGFETPGGFDDALLEEAVRVVTSTGMASTSGLQRRLRIGFTRAGRLIDMMEKAGIVGPADGARPREILVDEEDADDILDRIRGIS
ncbi:MAG: DNA translocase FtsK [Synergistaceae bacterium]|jgi:S-DNA-T family DNA segregation ATPase FtsK/SpoIIIE|nr:DNA translocase FtsK [Synergistaceae bacterium]